MRSPTCRLPYPLLLEAVSIRLASIRGLATRAFPCRAREAVLLGGHPAGCLALILLVLPPLKAAVFVAVPAGPFRPVPGGAR